jgi:hypothetical protein
MAATSKTWEEVEREAAAHASVHAGVEVYTHLFKRFIETTYPAFYAEYSKRVAEVFGSGIYPGLSRLQISADIAQWSDPAQVEAQMDFMNGPGWAERQVLYPDEAARMMGPNLWWHCSTTHFRISGSGSRPYPGAWEYAMKRISTPMVRRIIQYYRHEQIRDPVRVGPVAYRTTDDARKESYQHMIDDLEVEIEKRLEPLRSRDALARSGLIDRFAGQDRDAAHYLSQWASSAITVAHPLRIRTRAQQLDDIIASIPSSASSSASPHAELARVKRQLELLSEQLHKKRRED